ncbi:MAG: potassium transporter TrkA [Limnothrix sp. CACIAM 69d]|nr:MAG: potassium transporter TrkA [Limnothrix sp. CACIAM 69d]
MQTSQMQTVLSDRFLVCGLGNLGQHCVAALANFGVRVRAIERTIPSGWDVPDLPTMLEQVIEGDFCRSSILQRAGIADCRAILLLAGDDRINLKAALAARLLNPAVRLVVRSNRPHLNDLLARQFGNFVAFEPSRLSAMAFALAALQDQTIGAFDINGVAYRVRQRSLEADDPWLGDIPANLNNRSRLILGHWSGPLPLPPDSLFYGSSIMEPLRFGDWVAYVEMRRGGRWHEWEATATLHPSRPMLTTAPRSTPRWQLLRSLQQAARSLLHRSRLLQIALIYAGAVLGLLLLGTVILRHYSPYRDWFDAFCNTALLLLGGYADLFGDSAQASGVPRWLRLFGFSLTVVGTGLVGVLYALLTERLLSLRLRFAPSRPRLPDKDHVLVVGMGQVGQQIARLLLQSGQSVAGLTRQGLDDNTLGDLPLMVGKLPDTLDRVELERAKSIVFATDDEIANLEMALMVRQASLSTGLVIRTFDRAFSDTLVGLLPDAQVLCAYALAAEAFAGAAFGENILSLYRWGCTTMLVAEYRIEPGDTLVDLLLAEFACGYGAVPLLHERVGRKALEDGELDFPRLDRHLRSGDRLVVLASIEGLRRIERGELAPRSWCVRLHSASPQADFEGANAIARITGCSLAQARSLFQRLPTLVEAGEPPTVCAMYEYQARSLVASLRQRLVDAEALCWATDLG